MCINNAWNFIVDEMYTFMSSDIEQRMKLLQRKLTPAGQWLRKKNTIHLYSIIHTLYFK